MYSDVVVYAVAVLLLASVAIFIKAALFDRRPQKVGLILAIVALPLYAIYYNDVKLLDRVDLRQAIRPLENFSGADSNFHSDIAAAGLIAAFLLVRILVFQRVAVRRRLQRVHDPIANFFAGATLITLVSATLVSTFSWGWVGAVVLGGISTLVYLGALALLAAFVEVFVELSKLFSVWIKRKVFSIATRITRIASWLSSLGGRLVSRALIERIRADTSKQESIFLDEQETQDRRLEDAYVRDRNRRRTATQRRQARVPEQSETPVPGEALPISDGAATSEQA